jgi:hypothetical protein
MSRHRLLLISRSHGSARELCGGLSGQAVAQRFSIDPRTVAKMLAFSVPPWYPWPFKDPLLIAGQRVFAAGFLLRATGLSDRFTEGFFLRRLQSFRRSLIIVQAVRLRSRQSSGESTADMSASMPRTGTGSSNSSRSATESALSRVA